MNQTYEGNFDGRELKIGIVASRFNDFIVDHLVRGAREGLRKCGVPEGSVDLAWVPGSMELAFAAKGMAESGKYDALVCVGCVIRGATSHYDLVCAETAKGISQVSAQSGVPAIFSVVTTDTIEQAIERAGAKAGNKGFDGALAAVEMATLAKALRKGRSRKK
ncbi:MAG: 6,7-dimethyl-8-ribityllumazine synthase [Nitrospinota bacterium]